MREITTHHTNECNRAIRIQADDRDPNNGNASHVYWLDRPAEHAPPGAPEGTEPVVRTVLIFQHGPIKEVGTNGLTAEALLAVVTDYLSGFQSGAYACGENEQAVHHLKEAAHWLKMRTDARMARGVEGTHEK